MGVSGASIMHSKNILDLFRLSGGLGLHSRKTRAIREHIEEDLGELIRN